jgi:hypothetical protein
MLIDIETKQAIDDIPHEKDFRRWRRGLSDLQYDAITAELNDRIDNALADKQILTSSWIPGHDWSGTVFEPIYVNACDENADESGLCFGLFLWVALQQREEAWAFGRYEKNGVPIRGLTYFRVHL